MIICTFADEMRRMQLFLPTVMLTVLAALIIGCGTGERRYMERLLAESDSMNRNFINFTTDSVMLTVVDYYDRHGTPNEQMKAHYLLGCIYRDLGETPRAISGYQDAIAKADTNATDCDFRVLSATYSQMADMFHRQLLLTYEIEARQHAAYYAQRAGLPLYAVSDMKLSAGAYILLHKRDSAEVMLKKVVSLYKEYGKAQEALQASTMLMFLYIDRKEKLVELKQMIDEYDSNSNLFDEQHELPPSMRQYYYYKGKYYEGVNSLDSAEYYYRKIYRPNMHFVDKNPMLKGLLSVFRKRHQADSIAKYSQLYCETNDSSIAIKDQQLTAQMTASYKYNSIQKEALDNKTKAYRFLVMLVFSGILIAILVLSIIYTYKQYRKKREEQIRKHEQEVHQLKLEFADAIESYEENLHELRLLQESRKKVISIIQNEIDGLSRENEVYKTKLVESQRTITKINEDYERDRILLTEENKELKSKIDELKKKEGISEYLMASGQFAETEIVKQVKVMSGEPLTQMTQDNWDSLYKVFCEHFPTLCHDLIRQNFNTNTVRVCMLTVIGIRNNEQSNLIGIKKQIVTNCKTNLNSILFNEKTSRTLYKNLVSQYNIYTL